MKKRWPNEDRNSWNKSEVMKEFESQILSKYAFLEKVSQMNTKIPNASQIKEVTKAVSDLNVETGKLSKNLGGSAADDGLVGKKCSCDNTSDQMCEACMEQFKADDVAEAKDGLIDELQAMADEAIRNKNIKLAYKIERIISDVKGE